MRASVRRIAAEALPDLPQHPNRSFRRAIQQVICDAINSGTMPKGSYLPTTADLAARWGVVAGTVKRALAELGGIGVLANHPGIGWSAAVAVATMPGGDVTTPASWCAVMEVDSYAFDDRAVTTRVIVPGFTDSVAATLFGAAMADDAARFMYAAPMLAAEGFKELYGDERTDDMERA